MPTIVRWFRVTHDINQDPEIWELRETFGDRAGFIWLECLSIADRNSGQIGPYSNQIINQLASKCRTTRAKVSGIIGWCLDHGWISIGRPSDANPMPVRFQPDANPTRTRSESGEYLRVAKWRKYNPKRDVEQFPSETTPRLDSPDETKKKNKRAQAPLVSLPDWIPMESWNGFLEYRKRIRKPMTDRAVTLALHTLNDLKDQGNNPAAVLDQSVTNGWTGLFPVKNGTNQIEEELPEWRTPQSSLKIHQG